MIEGVDVSEYQNNVDWYAARAGGIRFAFIRCSDGDYLDKKFARNVEQAKGAGIFVGAYSFARPSLKPGSAQDAAAKFWERCKQLGTGIGELPPALDAETDGGMLSIALSRWFRDYARTLSELAGRPCVVYTFPSFWRSNVIAFEGGWAKDYPLWLAHYKQQVVTAPPPNGDGPMLLWPWGESWTFWQWAGDHGPSTPGVKGPCDRNRFNGDIAALEALANVPSGLPPEVA